MSATFLKPCCALKCAANYIKFANCQHIRHSSILTKNRIDHSTFLSRPAANKLTIETCDRRGFIGFVPDKKDGYGKGPKKETDMEHFKFGIKQLKKELKMWKDEITEELRNDPMLVIPPGNSKTIKKLLEMKVLNATYVGCL